MYGVDCNIDSIPNPEGLERFGTPGQPAAQWWQNGSLRDRIGRIRSVFILETIVALEGLHVTS